MKRSIPSLLLALCLLTATQSNAQIYEVQQLVLDIEKLSQLKSILQDMYKGYEIVEKGYTTIRDISKGNFDLHKAFLDGLLAVSPEVRKYYKVAEIINDELSIVREYKAALNRFKADKHFSVDEMVNIEHVFDRLFDDSEQSLNTLITVLTDGSLRASDNERVTQIDVLHKDMRGRLQFLRRFNNQTTILSIQRSHDQDDINQIKTLYGIE